MKKNKTVNLKFSNPDGITCTSLGLKAHPRTAHPTQCMNLCIPQSQCGKLLRCVRCFPLPSPTALPSASLCCASLGCRFASVCVGWLGAHRTRFAIPHTVLPFLLCRDSILCGEHFQFDSNFHDIYIYPPLELLYFLYFLLSLLHHQTRDQHT